MAEATVFVAQNSPAAMLRQAGMLIGIAASVALGAYVVIWARTPQYSMLFSDLSDRDLTQVVDALKSGQIPYRIEPGAGAVMVAAAQLDDARMKLAAAGLPRGANIGFELLEQEQGFGTSQFLEKARYQRAIEGELSRSIGRIDNVRAARVHIALPQETVFARQRREPSASVIVDLYGGRRLEPAQVDAIQHLVSASVPNLPAARVTIIDSKGNLLTEQMGDQDMRLTAQRFDYARRLEQSYAERIESILMPMVGADGVRAQVTADLDFTATEQTRESFNPDLPAVRSERLLEEERTGPGAGGVPGALSNTPPGEASAPEETAASETAPAEGEAAAPAAATAEKTAPLPSNRRTQTTRNYELDRTISHTKPSPGSIRRLSVAVVVRNPVAAPATDAAGGLTAEQIERMTQLVKEAIGFDAARGDTVSVTGADFLAPPTPEALPEPPIWKQAWVLALGKQVLGGIFVLILVFAVLRPTMKSLINKAGHGGMAGQGDGSVAALPPGSADGAGGVKALPAMQDGGPRLLAAGGAHDNLDQVKQFVAQDPRVAAQVIKGWVGD